MNRREFIAGLAGTAAWPLAARAQQGERVRRVGVLGGRRSQLLAFIHRLDRWPQRADGTSFDRR
jgi:hypothetical protein